MMDGGRSPPARGWQIKIFLPLLSGAEGGGGCYYICIVSPDKGDTNQYIQSSFYLIFRPILYHLSNLPVV